jgi:hypothetical protein
MELKVSQLCLIFMTKDQMIKAGAAAACGYDHSRDNLSNTIHSALNMLRLEKVVLVKTIEATKVYPCAPTRMAYQLNPLLDGMTDGRAMREHMALIAVTSPLDRIRAGAEDKPVAKASSSSWGSIFNTMAKNKQPA